jgi:hypothetical protein
MMILSDKHVERVNKEAREGIATSKLQSQSWTKWDLKLLGRVRADDKKDGVYREEWKKLKENNAEMKQDI